VPRFCPLSPILEEKKIQTPPNFGDLVLLYLSLKINAVAHCPDVVRNEEFFCIAPETKNGTGIYTEIKSVITVFFSIFTYSHPV
jgi:hypothetical protein